MFALIKQKSYKLLYPNSSNYFLTKVVTKDKLNQYNFFSSLVYLKLNKFTYLIFTVKWIKTIYFWVYYKSIQLKKKTISLKTEKHKQTFYETCYKRSMNINTRFISSVKQEFKKNYKVNILQKLQFLLLKSTSNKNRINKFILLNKINKQVLCKIILSYGNK